MGSTAGTTGPKIYWGMTWMKLLWLAKLEYLVQIKEQRVWNLDYNPYWQFTFTLFLQGNAKIYVSLPVLFLQHEVTNLPMRDNSILPLTRGPFLFSPISLGSTCHSQSHVILLLKYLKSSEMVLLLQDTHLQSPFGHLLLLSLSKV